MVDNSDGMEPPADLHEIYYLPGMGGRLNACLGEESLRRELALNGRETVEAFKKLRFGEQVDTAKQKLVNPYFQKTPIFLHNQ